VQIGGRKKRKEKTKGGQAPTEASVGTSGYKQIVATARKSKKKKKLKVFRGTTPITA